jgi:hypothetical protein
VFAKGLSVNEDTASPVEASFGLKNGSVKYSNIRRDGFLGTKIVDRSFNLQLTTKILDRRSGTILFQSDVEDSASDTIALSQIEQVENPAILMTKGVVPREGFFSNVAEPLILLGSIAVAVLLLFNVRS